MATDIKLGVGFDFDLSGLRTISSAIDLLQREVDRVAINVDTDQGREDIAEFKLELELLQDIMSSSYNLKLNNINIDKFENGLKQAGLSMDALRQKSYSYGVDAAAAFARVENLARLIQMPLKQTLNILDRMALTLSNTIKWNLASSAVNNMTGAISQAWGYTKSLDSSLNSIRIVTGLSADEMDRFAKTANSAAQSLGVATTDYTKASLIYAQLGLQGEDLTTRTEITSKVANVTGQSTQSVSELLTAVWNGYKVSASEAELYIDRLAAVAAKSASNLEELSTGMSKVASSANMMGVSEELLAALLSTIISVTRQAPESVGTALKTIYSRMTLINAGMSEDGASLKSYTEDMAKYGISVLDAQGKLRDMGEVIEEIGGKWTNFTQEQQTAIAQTMGGARQYNMITALFENWDQYNNMMQVLATAAGTLQALQDVYLESMSAHLQTMSTAAENVFDSLMNKDTTDGIKDLVDGFTSLLNVIASAVDSVNGLGGVLRNVGAIALTVFNRQLGQGFANFATKNYGAEAVKAQRESIALLLLNENESISTSSMRKNMNTLKLGIIQSSQYLSPERLAQINAQFDNLNIAITQTEAAEKQLQDVAPNIFKGLDIKDPIQDLDKVEQKIKEVNEAFTLWIDTLSNNKFKSIDEASNIFTDINTKKNRSKIVDTKNRKNSNNLTELQRNVFKDASANIEELTNSYNQAAKTANYDKLINPEDIALMKSSYELLANGGRLTAEQLKKLKEAQDRVNQTMQEGGEDVLVISDRFNKFLGELHKTVAEQDKLDLEMLQQSAQKVGQSLTQISSVALAIVNVITNGLNFKDIITNEDLSPLEKFLQSLSMLTFIIPLVAIALKGLKAAKDLNKSADLAYLLLNKGIISENSKRLVSEGKLTIMQALKTAGTEADTKAVIANKIARLGWIAVAGLAIAALIGLVKAVRDNIKALEDFNNAVAEKEALKEITQQAKELLTAYEDIKSARDGLFESIDSYQTEIDNLKTLTEGTEEYKNALQAANEEALNLMSTYGIEGDLENGLWVLDLELLDNLKKLANDRVVKALQASLQGLIDVLKQNIVYERGKAFNKLGIDGSSLLVSDLVQSKNKKDIKEAFDNIQEITSKELAETLQKILEEARKEETDALKINELDQAINYLANAASTFLLLSSGSRVANIPTYNIGERLGEDFNISDYIPETIFDNVEEAIAQVLPVIEQANDNISSLTRAIINTDAKDVEGYNGLTNASQDNYSLLVNSLYGNEYDAAYEKALKANTGNAEELTTDEILNSLGYDPKEVSAIIEDGLVKIVNLEGEAIALYSEQGYEIAVSQALASAEVFTEDRKKAVVKQLQYIDKNANNISNSTDIDPNLIADIIAKTNLNKDNPNYLYDNILLLDPEKQEELVAELKRVGFKSAAGSIERGYSYETGVDYYENLMANSSSFDLLEANYRKANTYIMETPKNKLDRFKAYAESAEAYSLALQGLAAQYENLAPLLERYKQLKENFEQTDYTSEEELEQALKLLDIEERKLAISVASAELAKDSGLNAEEIEYYAQAFSELEEYQNASASSLAELAKALIRYNKAIKDVPDKINDWKKALESIGDGILDYETAQDIAEAYGDIFNIDASKLPQSFLKSTENLDLMQKALKGNSDAYNELQSQIRDTLAEAYNIKDITFEISPGEAENAFEYINSVIDNFDPNSVDIPVNVNLEELIAAMNAILSTFSGTADAAKGMMADIFGLDVTVKLATKTEQELVGYDYEYYQDGTTTGYGYSEIGGETQTLKLSYPVMRVRAKPRFADKQISATGFEVESVDGVVSGGNIKFENAPKSPGGGSGGSGGGGGGGGSAPKKAKVLKLTETKKDPFHNVERRLGDLTDAYDKLADAQERLIGDEQIKNLEQQLDLLEEQKEVQEEKLQIANDEAKRLAENLKDNYKIAFGENGEITNYFEVMEKELKDLHDVETWYNTLSGDAQEDEANSDRLSKAQERYDAIVEDIQEYEDMLDKIDETAKSISDTIKSKIEIEIKKVQVKVEVSETLKDFRDAWTEFLKTLAQLEDSDFALNFNYSVLTLLNIIDSNKLSALSEAINSNLALLKEYPNESTILDNLKEDTQGLIDTITEVYEAYGESKDIFADGISQVKDYYDTLNDYYDLLLGLIDHLKSSYELIYGDEAYNKLSAFFTSQLEITQLQEQSLRDQVIYWEQMMQNAENEDIYQKYYENYKDATDAFNASVESTLEILKDLYSNTISDIFQQWSNELTNGAGLDNLESLFDMSLEANESFYDSAERGFKVQEIIDKWNDSINNSDNATVQNKLTKAMNELLSILEAKTKLNEKDVALAEKEIELILKQIAIEESQQAKNQMRLTRDANGNYTYKFVANLTEVNKAEEERNKALSALYDETKASYNEALQNIISAQKELQDQLKEYAETYANDEEMFMLMSLAAIKSYQTRTESSAQTLNTTLEYFSKYAKEWFGEDLSDLSEQALMDYLNQNNIGATGFSYDEVMRLSNMIIDSNYMASLLALMNNYRNNLGAASGTLEGDVASLTEYALQALKNNGVDLSQALTDLSAIASSIGIIEQVIEEINQGYKEIAEKGYNSYINAYESNTSFEPQKILTDISNAVVDEVKIMNNIDIANKAMALAQDKVAQLSSNMDSNLSKVSSAIEKIVNNNTTIGNEFTVYADFSGVESSKEIKEAFNDMPNLVWLYIGKI